MSLFLDDALFQQFAENNQNSKSSQNYPQNLQNSNPQSQSSNRYAHQPQHHPHQTRLHPFQFSKTLKFSKTNSPKHLSFNQQSCSQKFQSLHNIFDEYQKVSMKQAEIATKISEFFYQNLNSTIHHELGLQFHKRMTDLESLRFQKKGMFQSESRRLVPMDLLKKYVDDEYEIAKFKISKFEALKTKLKDIDEKSNFEGETSNHCVDLNHAKRLTSSLRQHTALPTRHYNDLVQLLPENTDLAELKRTQIRDYVAFAKQFYSSTLPKFLGITIRTLESPQNLRILSGQLLHDSVTHIELNSYKLESNFLKSDGIELAKRGVKLKTGENNGWKQDLNKVSSGTWSTITEKNLDDLANELITCSLFNSDFEATKINSVNQLITPELLGKACTSFWYNHVRITLLTAFGNQGLTKFELEGRGQNEKTPYLYLKNFENNLTANLTVCSEWTIYDDPQTSGLLLIQPSLEDVEKHWYGKIEVEFCVSFDLNGDFYYNTLLRLKNTVPQLGNPQQAVKNESMGNLDLADIELAIEMMSFSTEGNRGRAQHQSQRQNASEPTFMNEYSNTPYEYNTVENNNQGQFQAVQNQTVQNHDNHEFQHQNPHSLERQNHPSYEFNSNYEPYDEKSTKYIENGFDHENFDCMELQDFDSSSSVNSFVLPVSRSKSSKSNTDPGHFLSKKIKKFVAKSDNSSFTLPKN